MLGWNIDCNYFAWKILGNVSIWAYIYLVFDGQDIGCNRETYEDSSMGTRLEVLK